MSSFSARSADETSVQHEHIGNCKNRGETKCTQQTSRLELLQNEARTRAEKKHAAMKAIRPTRVYSKPNDRTYPSKPKRILTKRELSSKRSAEICRIKAQIYTELLEKSVLEEERKQTQIQAELQKCEEQVTVLKAQIVKYEHINLSPVEDYSIYSDVHEDEPIVTPPPSSLNSSNFGAILNNSFLLTEAMESDDVPSFFRTAQLEECGFLSTLSPDAHGNTKCTVADTSLHGNVDVDININSMQDSFSPTTIVCSSDLPFLTPLKQVSSIRTAHRDEFFNEYL